MKLFCVLLILFLTGCGDRYSLDEKRGPDPKGFVTTHPLSLPPDYLLRAPEPTVKEKTPAKEEEKTEEKEEQKPEENKTEKGTSSSGTDETGNGGNDGLKSNDAPQRETSKTETGN